MLSLAIAALPQAVVDRIAAVVNRQAITASELEDAAWWARFSAHGDAGAALTAAELHTALEHTIDQHLLLQARADEGYAWAPDAEVAAQAARLDAGDLARYHLDAATARELLRRQLTILDMLDQRLGEPAAASTAEVADYYQKTFVPQARAAGITPAPLAAVSAKIAAILRQQKLDEAGAAWVASLRQSAQIDIRPQP